MSQTRRQNGFWLLITLGLLLYYASRLHNLTALPLFIDESIIVQWSVESAQGSPIGFGYHGKYLLPWVSVPFQPHLNAAFTLRVVTLFFVMIGAASSIALARHIAGRRSGLFALVAVLLTPMLFFFDRMALTDTVLHGTLSLFLLSLFWVFDRKQSNVRLAALGGALFVLAVLAKSTALTMLPLPIIAAVLLPRGWHVAARLRALATLYGTAFLLWLPLQVVLIARDINYLGLADQFSGGTARPFIERIGENTAFVLAGLGDYFQPVTIVLMLLAMLAAIIGYTRRSLLVLALVGGLFMAIILLGISGLSLRYWLAMIPPALVLVAVGCDVLLRNTHLRDARMLLASLPLALLLIGIVGFINFAVKAYDMSLDLPLPFSDYHSYLASDAAGTGLPQIADYLRQHLPDEIALGAISSCYTLSLYYPPLQCVDVIADNDRVARVEAAIEQTGAALIVLESPGYVAPDDIAQLVDQPLLAISRPGGISTLMLYELAP